MYMHLYWAISLKKEEKISICHNMDLPGGHYAKKISQSVKCFLILDLSVLTSGICWLLCRPLLNWATMASLRPWISLTIHGKNTPSISLKIFLRGKFSGSSVIRIQIFCCQMKLPKKKKKGLLKCAAPFHEPWLEIFVPWDLILAKNQVSFSWSLNSFIFFLIAKYFVVLFPPWT